MTVDWTKAQQMAARTGRWAAAMAKVRIRRVLARTRWQLVTVLIPIEQRIHQRSYELYEQRGRTDGRIGFKPRGEKGTHENTAAG